MADMKALAIIPARGGSKRLPRKNLALVGGLPLVCHSIRAALGAGATPHVSTEDDEIARVAAAHGAIVCARPIALAQDRTTTEAVITDWWRRLPKDERPDAIVLLQPSTLILGDASAVVRDMLHALAATGADSVVAVTVDEHEAFAGRIYPREGGVGDWRPHRPAGSRPRTQDIRWQAREEGAAYAFTAQHWATKGDRMGGAMKAYPMPRHSVVDIDTERDLVAARALYDAMSTVARTA